MSETQVFKLSYSPHACFSLSRKPFRVTKSKLEYIRYLVELKTGARTICRMEQISNTKMGRQILSVKT